MEVDIRTKDFKVSQGLREYVQERVDKLDRFVGRGANAKLELTHEHNRTGGDLIVAQVTIAIRHTLLRAEEQHTDARRALDLALDKIGSQLRRYHNKRTDRSRVPNAADFATTLPTLSDDAMSELAAIAADGEDDEDRQEIVRTKRFSLKPMSSFEAIDQLELLGHDFFVFLNADDDRVNVLYRRKNGHYGLIQPE
jgi:putative sigma-54 modulation protein